MSMFARVKCDQKTGRIEMSFDMEVGLDRGQMESWPLKLVIVSPFLFCWDCSYVQSQIKVLKTCESFG